MLLCLLALCLAIAWWGLMATRRYGGPFRAASARVQGHLLEVLLYGAYPRVMLRSLAAVTRASLRLSWTLLVPSLWFCLPLIPVLVLGQAYYGFAPVPPQSAVLLELRSAQASRWTLQPSAGLAVEVDGFTAPDGTVRLWRLRPEKAGVFTLRLASGDQVVEKSLSSGDGFRLLSRSRQSGWGWLTSPLEGPLPSDLAVQEVRVDYATRDLTWNGWSAPWWLGLLLAFLGWSWLLALLGGPGNLGPIRQPPPHEDRLL